MVMLAAPLLYRASLTADCSVMLHGTRNDVGPGDYRRRCSGTPSPGCNLMLSRQSPKTTVVGLRDRRRRWDRNRRGGLLPSIIAPNSGGSPADCPAAAVAGGSSSSPHATKSIANMAASASAASAPLTRTRPARAHGKTGRCGRRLYSIYWPVECHANLSPQNG